MSSRPRATTISTVSTAPKPHAEAHLPLLQRLVRIFPADRRVQLLALIALLNLSARGVKPAVLTGGGETLLKMIGGAFPKPISTKNSAQGPLPDDTAFSGHCCAFLKSLEPLTGDECRALVESFQVALKQTMRSKSKAVKVHSAEELILAIAEDPLAVGWAREFCSAEQKHPTDNDSLARTQFFTPSWIAQYLCQEAQGHKDAPTLLDPACGAGHLLVRALETACDGLDKSQLPTALSEILESSLYGLEVDERLAELAAFSIYLKARDILRETHPGDWLADLPKPKIFCLQKPLGSLALAAGALPADLPPSWPQAFDAIVMNPPYLSTRTMDDTTADFLKSYYPTSSGDLYTAFMQLAVGLLKPGGRLSTIVQQSFLSISRYRTFRLQLFNETRLISCVQLGTGAFPSRPGEKVNNALITLERGRATGDEPINILRLQGKGDHLSARDSGLLSHAREIVTYGAARDLINSIPGQPFAFHCHPEVAALFESHRSLSDCANDFVLTNGLFTCDNNRFVKLADDLSESEISAGDFVPYDKGGGRKWYHETPYRLRWGGDGKEIRKFRLARGQSRSLPGEAQYFRPGITYSYIGTSGFCARLLSPGAIFDIASSAIFSNRYDLHMLLAWLNSALVAYLLSILNPTVNFQIGDLRKLPFKPPSRALEETLAKLATEAVSIAKEVAHGEDDPAMIEREQKIQAQIDELIFSHYGLSKLAQDAILSEPWVQRGLRPLKAI